MIFNVKTGNTSKAHNLPEHLKKLTECFEELYYSLIMSDVEKRRPIFVAFCLNKLYGCCTSLQTFFNFLIMKKEQKKQQNNSQDHPILKFSKKEGKRNSPRFWI